MSHAIHHPGSPFRALYAQAVALRDPLHRRDAAASASLGHAMAQPVSLEAFRRASHHRRSTVVRITNALGLFVALYAAVVLMRFAG